MNKPKKSFKQLTAEVSSKADAAKKEWHGRLHDALKASGHTAQPIPKSREYGKLPSGNPEKAFMGGAHGWVHPDGTYYHIDQPEGLESYRTSQGAQHHSHAKDKMRKHFRIGTADWHLDHLAQITGTIGQPKNMVVTSRHPLTFDQQSAIRVGAITGGYYGLEHEHKPRDPKKRNEYETAFPSEYGGKHEAQIRKVLRLGHPKI